MIWRPVRAAGRGRDEENRVVSFASVHCGADHLLIVAGLSKASALLVVLGSRLSAVPVPVVALC